MLLEKNLSIALTAIGFALAAPNAFAILQKQSHGGGTGMIMGGLIGAAGVFLGARVAASYSEKRARIVRLILWATAAGLLTVTVGIGATGGDSITMRISIGMAGVLPLAAMAVGAAGR